MTRPALPDALYYLRNFREAIQWVVARNRDLLSPLEWQFASGFEALPVPAQALLARLSLRRGDLFRGSKIQYAEIEPISDAFSALIEIGWIDPAPRLSLQEVFRLSTRADLAARFGERVERLTKHAAYEALIETHPDERRFQDWLNTQEPVHHVAIAPMVLKFRLLHFGNFYQEWHEYSLAHLQVFMYEPVPLDPSSRPFESREDIDFFYALYECHEAASEGAELAEVIGRLPQAPKSEGWLRRRWDRLRHQLGQEAERQQEHETALQMYGGNTLPDAQVRHVRLLERLERDAVALRAARALLEDNRSELIAQRVGRIVSRLERRLGSKPVKRVYDATWSSIELQLSYDPDQRVETRVQAHLSSPDTPVTYVENSLICSLFGLLCWEAIFQPVRGAFFHPFQSGPADLGCPDFVARRRDAFNSCLRSLASGEHADIILRTYVKKQGISAPFVHWRALDEATLHLALTCIPATHLQMYFTRLLDDLSENSSGFPDLVQFFPATPRYRFIEVKGPGDRVQDNQRRWLEFCARRGLPMEVWHVSWV